MAAGARVLILGGCGFIGRNLVHYLVTNSLASYIRVVDKVMPSTAFMNRAHTESFNNPIVEFKQAYLVRDDGVTKAFTDGVDAPFNFVINLAAETKYGQTEAVYQEKILDTAIKVARAAIRYGHEKFIEMSTGQVYEAERDLHDETDKTKPWTTLATYKLRAEQALLAMQTEGLKVVVVRPAIVYGPGDIQGISPRLIVGAVYKQLGETMELLWNKDLKMNTVHVRDVAKALWHLCQNGEVGKIYNLADKEDTRQITINNHLETIYGIKTKFAGTIMSQLAKATGFKEVTESVNEKHLKPWSDLCRAAGIENTPLTPYLDQELLYNNSLGVDGRMIESTGFVYDHPNVTLDLLNEQIQYFVEQGIFPESSLRR